MTTEPHASTDFAVTRPPPRVALIVGTGAVVVGMFFASLLFCTLRARYCPELVGATFADMLAGTADTPFQYRMLVPLLAHGIIAATGLRLDHPTVLSLSIELVTVWLILLVAAAALRRRGLSLLWLAALYYMMVVNYVVDFGYNFLNCADLPALLFALLGLLLVAERRHVWFTLMLPLALLNRETGVLLSALFLLVEAGRMQPARLAGHLAIQAVLFLAIKATLTWIFRDNHGPHAASLFVSDYTGGARQLADLRLWRNLQPGSLLRLPCVFGGLWLPLLWRVRRIDDRVLARAVWLFPPVFLLMLVVGNITEFRIFTELIPILLFALAAIRRRGPVLGLPPAWPAVGASVDGRR